MEKQYLIGYGVTRLCTQQNLERLVGRLERRWQALTSYVRVRTGVSAAIVSLTTAV